MVLQDVENQAPDSFTDNPSPSDNDPYASPSSPALVGGERFDASNMPRPIPVIAPFIGFSQRAVRFKVDTTLSFAEKKLGRTLTGEEAQALAFHIYNLERKKSYYTTAGVAAGVYRWYATMSTYRYPFYQPKIESIDPNKFGPIKGPAASMARQTWRFGLYALVAGQMGDVIGQLIAQPMAAADSAKDPKLEQFGKELKASQKQDEKTNNERGRMIEERRKDFDARRREEGKGGMTPPYGGRQQAAPVKADDDDMSPTAGNEAWGTGTSSSGSWGEFASEDQPKPLPERQSVDVSKRQHRQAPAASSSPYDNDASPTGGLFASESYSSSQPASRPGESSWDRLRRGATPPSASPQSQQDRRATSGNDDFTFAGESDGDRARAQREFDERLERERRGGDFNEGGVGGKKW